MEMLIGIQVLVLVVVATLLSTVDAESNDIYRYRRNFFIGNGTYSVNYVGSALLHRDCSGIPYTHIVRQRGCFPVYVKNNLCGGLCKSMTVPKQNQLSRYSDNVISTCVACGPEKLVKKEVHMLCKRKHRSGINKSKFRVVKRVVKVIETCSCQKYKCSNYPKEHGNLRR